MKALKRVLNVVKRQRCTDPQNIDLDEVCRLLGGYYRCSVDEGYPFLFLSDNFLVTLGWTKKEIEQNFDNKLINMFHPYDKKIY